MDIKECKNINEVREQIDSIDKKIVQLISLRGNYVKQAAQFKKTANDVKAPDRVEQVIEKVKTIARQYDLQGEIIENVYRTMINTFITYEMNEHKKL